MGYQSTLSDGVHFFVPVPDHLNFSHPPKKKPSRPPSRDNEDLVALSHLGYHAVYIHCYGVDIRSLFTPRLITNHSLIKGSGLCGNV